MSTSVSSSRIKRTYGSKKKATTPVRLASPGLASSSCSADVPSSSDAIESTPPTSPRPAATAASTVMKATSPAKRKGNGLHAFFKNVSPPKKRARHSSPTYAHDCGDENEPPSSSSTSARKKGKRAPKLEQLFLDPFDKAVGTLSCAVCNMSYARTPEDMLLHDKHHKRVVAGCDWLTGTHEAVTLIEDDIQYRPDKFGKIVMVDAVQKGALGRRINELLETIDTSLSASSLTEEQLARSKVIAFVTRSHKVIAAAVAERVSSAYPVVSSSPANDSSLVRFGEDEGAVFCHPEAVPCSIGIHRIWTSSTQRRLNLASRVLTATASNFVYGSPIPASRYAEEVAFSQPTNAGMALARNWTGSSSFCVFVDT